MLGKIEYLIGYLLNHFNDTFTFKLYINFGNPIIFIRTLVRCIYSD